jgi:hypothetical protein
MNRVIKFRVWDIEMKMWINNIGMSKNNILSHGNSKRFHIMQFTGLYDNTKWADLTENEREQWTLNGNMPSEWKGREIYEGDIGVRYLDLAKRYTDGKTWRDYWLVEWDNESSGFVTTMFADYDTRFEKVVNVVRNTNPYSRRFKEIKVIGNIHEYRNLLITC